MSAPARSSYGITEAAIPSVEQEAARGSTAGPDLVRARDDVRRDLMSARHRVSKLLLRQGIVYSSGQAWTKTHQRWLRTHSFRDRGVQLAYDTALDTMLATVDRRDRLDEAITAMAAQSTYTRWRPGCVVCAGSPR